MNDTYQHVSSALSTKNLYSTTLLFCPFKNLTILRVTPDTNENYDHEDSINSMSIEVLNSRSANFLIKRNL